MLWTEKFDKPTVEGWLRSEKSVTQIARENGNISPHLISVIVQGHWPEYEGSINKTKAALGIRKKQLL